MSEDQIEWIQESASLAAVEESRRASQARALRRSKRKAQQERLAAIRHAARIDVHEEDEATDGFPPGVDDVAAWEREGLER